jgi:hypothetical protein
MLSLPEDWDYTLAGLAKINRESVDAVRTAVWELEKAGYIIRRQGRDGKGKMTAIEYIIYEQPQKQEPEPMPPILDCPVLENPIPENPLSENPTQLNKEVSIKERLKKDPINPILSPFPCDDGMDEDEDDLHSHSQYEKRVRENIDLDGLLASSPKNREAIIGMYRLIVDTVCGGKEHVSISGNRYPRDYVRERLLRLTSHHLLYVLDSLAETTSKARNMKSYMLAALFNAPATIDSYYTNRVRHDRACGRI